MSTRIAHGATPPELKAPCLMLPMPITAGECMALSAVAKSMATDRADLSHTKQAIGEAESFLRIAKTRNGRSDYGAAHDALARAAAILVRALAALDERHEQALAEAREAHGNAIEAMYDRATRRNALGGVG